MVQSLSSSALRNGGREEQIQDSKVRRANLGTADARFTPSRKIILCAVSRQDYTAACEAFSKMSAIGRNEPTTRYLMYKVALHDNNHELSMAFHSLTSYLD